MNPTEHDRGENFTLIPEPTIKKVSPGLLPILVAMKQEKITSLFSNSISSLVSNVYGSTILKQLANLFSPAFG